jgi:hypothetical protein
LTKFSQETLKLDIYGLFNDYKTNGFELTTFGQLVKNNDSPIGSIESDYHSWISLFADIFQQYPTQETLELHFLNEMENYPLIMVGHNSGIIQIYEDEPFNMNYFDEVSDTTTGYVFNINRYINCYKTTNTLQQVNEWKFDTVEHSINQLNEMFDNLNL